MMLIAPLYANQTTEQCKADFDKKISDMQTLKSSAETFINGAKDKIVVIKKAYKEVDAYEKKIRLLSRNNFVKSILMLGLNTIQEISPLSNSGRVLDVIMWFEGKAQDYVLSTKVIPQKDYYDRQIVSVGNDCKNLTSEVKLLSQMSKAGLEAFKTKLQREQNKTVGNVGALYAKLSALVNQSENAKKSLYNFYRKLNGLIAQSNAKLAKINGIILSYSAAKDNTCKEQSSEANITIDDYNIIKITYQPVIVDDTCDEGTHQAILAEQDNNLDLLTQTFNDKLTKIDQNITTLQKEFQTYTEQLQTSDFPIHILKALAVYGYDSSLLSCDFTGYNKMSDVISASYAYYQNLLLNLNEVIKKMETNIKLYDPLADYLDDNKYERAIKAEENTLRIAIKCGEGNGDLLIYDIKRFKKDIKNAKETALNILQKERKKQKAIKNVKNKILPDTVTAINECLDNDKKTVSKYIPIVEDEINKVDEYTMSKVNLLNYLQELKDKHIAYYHKDGQTHIYDINATYFKSMYDNFKGNDIEFLKKIKNIILPIHSKLSKLYNFYKIDKSFVCGNSWANVFSFNNPSLSPESLLVNIEEMKTLKELMQEEDTMCSNISSPNLDLRILTDFMDDFLVKGHINTVIEIDDKLEKFEPFATIAYNLHLENQQKNNQLGSLSNDLNNGFYKDINGYKEAKQTLDKLRDYYYQLGQVYDIGNQDDKITKTENILYAQAKTSLTPTQAEQFDYSKPQVYKTPEPMDINISNSHIDLPSLSKREITVNVNTAYGIKVTLTAIDDSNASLKLTPSWNGNLEDSEYKDKNFTLQIDSLDDKDATYTITLKLEDYNAALFGGSHIQPYITKTITVNVFSGKKTISLKKGWNLISGSINLYSLPKDIDIVWGYSDGFWYGFSPFDYLQKLLLKASIGTNINLIKSIPDDTGVWVHSLKDQDIQILLKNSTQAQKVIKKPGWNLAGTKKEIQVPDDISCSDGRTIQAVWEYDSGDKTWQNYQKDSNISTLKNIGEDKGFWVFCM